MRSQLIPIVLACVVSRAGRARADDSPAAARLPGVVAASRRAGPEAGAHAAGTLPPALLQRPAGARGNSAQDVAAQPTSASNPAPLSLATVESLALQNNPTIRAAESLVIQQQGLVRQLTRYPNPTLGWIPTTPSQRTWAARISRPPSRP